MGLLERRSIGRGLAFWTRAIASALALVSACASYEEQSAPSALDVRDAGPGADCCVASDTSVDALVVPDVAALDAGSPDSDAARGPVLAMKVVAGPTYACAILIDGRVKCWGTNGVGELGVGDTIPRGGGDAGEAMGNALSAVPLGGKALDVALGRIVGNSSQFAFACALVEGGDVKCWGDNSYGQLGRGNTVGVGSTPESALAIAPVNLGEAAVAIGTGAFSACALLSSGGVKCWGRGLDGQLGYGDTVTRGNTPGSLGAALPYVPLGTKATSIAVGIRHACALLDSGEVKCWGHNELGELGINSATAVGEHGGLDASLLASDLGAPATAIYAGHYDSCAVLERGELTCWGYNAYANLGLGDTTTRGGGDGGVAVRDLPKVELGDGGRIIGATLGSRSTCVVREDGTGKCWGSNVSGNLGLGDTVMRGDDPNEMGNSLPPLPFPKITSISAGDSFTCAVTEGRVKCWGTNEYGQLGLGDRVTRGDKPGFEFVLPHVDLGD